MSLGYLGKPKTWKTSWRAVLAFLAIEQFVSAQQVANKFRLGREVEVLEIRNGREMRRRRHTGPSEANVRLKRLAEWGMARRGHDDDGKLYYEITEYGKKVNKAGARPS